MKLELITEIKDYILYTYETIFKSTMMVYWDI